MSAKTISYLIATVNYTMGRLTRVLKKKDFEQFGVSSNESRGHSCGNVRHVFLTSKKLFWLRPGM